MPATPSSLLTPSQIATDYLTYLSNLQPNLDVSLTDSDWYIRAQVTGGVVAGVYADNLLISNDAFPQSARSDALAQWLQTLFGNNPVLGYFLPATISQGYAAVTGNPGQTVLVDLQATYAPNGNTYNVQTSTTLDPIAGTGLVPFQSVSTGQAQNLLPGAILTFPAPPAGLNSTAIVASGGFSDGTDPESAQAAAARILFYLQNGISVGRAVDYEQYAKDADPSVTSASVSRFIYGPGTIGIYITAGTTDIDSALDNGQPVSVLPSPQLLAIVQAYVDQYAVETDCVTVLSAVPLNVAVTVQVSYVTGDGTTVPAGDTLTQAQLVQREVQRAIYKTPVGGRVIGASGGFLIASDIEQTIDENLSGEPTEAGASSIVADRQVLPLSVSGYNLSMSAGQVAIPGTITIIPF